MTIGELLDWLYPKTSTGEPRTPVKRIFVSHRVARDYTQYDGDALVVSPDVWYELLNATGSSYSQFFEWHEGRTTTAFGIPVHYK